jgi:uncharacterized membrane protein YagU involved in acid resistance
MENIVKCEKYGHVNYYFSRETISEKGFVFHVIFSWKILIYF